MKPRLYLASINDYYWTYDNDNTYSAEKFLILPSVNFHISILSINQTIKALVPFGLPPLGIICIFYYNVSDSGYNRKNDFLYHINLLQKTYEIDINIDAANNFINNLSEIPKTTFSKIKLSDLIKILCENHSKLITPEESQLINNYIDIYNKDLSNKQRYNEKNIKEVLENDINFLVELNYNFPTKKAIEDVLQNYFQVDIDEENEKELLEESIEDFFEKLKRNKNTENLPFQINYLWNNLRKDIIKKTTGEMSLGGIEDISNKGKIEQLLLSEFAYDDFDFINRFINNESLYIKREIPPIQEEKTHHFLIDLSINSWGIPKELMFSICLSFIKQKKIDLIYKAWVIGNSFEQIELNNSSDVFNAFDYLSINEHPINGFEDFIKNLEDINQQEIYLCINNNTFESREFKTFLAQNISIIKLIFVVKRDQTIQFYKIKNQKKYLYYILKLPHNKQRKLDSSCQILLPYLAKKSNKIFYLDKHFYILTSNYDLLKSYHETDDNYYEGVYELLYKKIPQFYKNCILGKQNGELFLVGIAKKSQKVVIYNLDRKIWKRVDYKDSSNSELYFTNDFLILNQYNNYFKIIFDNDLNDAQIKNIPSKPSYSNDFPNMQKEEIIPFQKFNISKNHKLTFNRSELIFTNDNVYLEELENNQNIYYNLIRKNNRIKINDDSFINIDYLGIATINDNFNNQKIYIPLSYDRPLALATDEYFCGNDEYFDDRSDLKIISPLEFESLIIKPFIEKLISNERN